MANLLLVEDHLMVRAGIRALLERSNAAHRIVAEAADGLTAARFAKDLQPELALVDVTMPEMNGIECARLILRNSPNTRIIMLSMHPDAAFVRAALDAGAMGYVLKDAAFGDLEAAIRAALTGERYLSPKVRQAIKGSGPVEWGPASPAFRNLSRRERQVLQMIGEAFSSPEIAEKLGLSVRTIETYRQHMMDKLDLHSVAALTAFALRHGICDPNVGRP